MGACANKNAVTDSLMTDSETTTMAMAGGRPKIGVIDNDRQLVVAITVILT